MRFYYVGGCGIYKPGDTNPVYIWNKNKDRHRVEYTSDRMVYRFTFSDGSTIEHIINAFGPPGYYSNRPFLRLMLVTWVLK